MKLSEKLEMKEKEAIKEAEEEKSESLKDWYEGRASAFAHAKKLAMVKDV